MPDDLAITARTTDPVSPPPRLAVEALNVVYDTSAWALPAVTDVSFTCRSGDRIGIVGESGSGKTTLATALARLSRPPARIASGRVLVDGEDILALPQGAVRRVRLSRVAYVPQGSMNSLNPVVRAETQIRDAIRAHRPDWGRDRIEERIDLALDRVALPRAVRRKYPHELSGGMRQRLVMAIATVLDPAIIIADEPTSALDVVVQRQVIRTLIGIQREIGAAVLMVGHDMGLMAQFATKIAVMYAGHLVEFGPVDAVIASPMHPYTRALVAALPTLDGRRALTGLPGLPPSLAALPAGCRFHPRCPDAQPSCREDPVPRPAVVGDRMALCRFPVGPAVPATGRSDEVAPA